MQQLFLPLSREPFLGRPLQKAEEVLPGSCVSRIPSNWFFSLPRGKGGCVSAEGVDESEGKGKDGRKGGEKKAIGFVVHMALHASARSSARSSESFFFLETLKFDLRDR